MGSGISIPTYNVDLFFMSQAILDYNPCNLSGTGTGSPKNIRLDGNGNIVIPVNGKRDLGTSALPLTALMTSCHSAFLNASGTTAIAQWSLRSLSGVAPMGSFNLIRSSNLGSRGLGQGQQQARGQAVWSLGSAASL
jgi:hypothetical protein